MTQRTMGLLSAVRLEARTTWSIAHAMAGRLVAMAMRPRRLRRRACHDDAAASAVLPSSATRRWASPLRHVATQRGGGMMGAEVPCTVDCRYTVRG